MADNPNNHLLETAGEVAPSNILAMEPRSEPPRQTTSPSEDILSALASPPFLAPSPYFRSKPLPLRTRNLSPSSPRRMSPHPSPKTSPRSTGPHAMTRAQSMPVMDEAGRHLLSPTSAVRSSSPLGSGRHRSSSSRRSDEPFLESSGRYLSFLSEPVPEDSELESTTPMARVGHGLQSTPSVPLYPSNSFPRRRHTPPALRSLTQPPLLGFIPSTPTSATSSPSLGAGRFNEAYPSSSSTNVTSYPFSFSSTSSLPSTPTSARSRSPSISSLETIPDSPDAEEAALEAERILQLKEAADAADAARGEGGDHGHRRRGSADNTSGAGISRGSGGGLMVQVIGTGFASRDKKKRWSVCGGERRGDLDLETIWED